MNDQANAMNAHIFGADMPSLGLQHPERRTIEPTIGRKVWYRHDGSGVLDYPTQQWSYPTCINADKPMDATVVYVWGPNMVNLLVTDHAGKSFALTSVTLRQPADPLPTGRYCEWMPYQVGRA